MSTEVGAIHYTLDLDDKQFRQGLDSASGAAKGFGGHMEAAKTGSFALLGGLTAVAAGAVAFGAASVGAYNDSTEALTKLRTNLLNVKGATDAHVESLTKQAAHLQSIGVIEDDTIIAGQAQLATFNLQGSTIEKLTPKITDMVAQLKGHNATSEDMVGINNLVGKVMTGNVGALSRYGVTLDENQAKVLANGTESEKAAKLVEVLGQNYGNVNEALRNTPEGQITALKNTFGDFMELVGAGVSQAITPLVAGFNDWFASMGGPDGVLKSLKSTFEAIMPYFPIIAGAIMAGLVPAFWAMAAGVWAAMAPLLPFLAIGAALGAAFMLLKSQGIDPLKVAVDFLKMAWDFLKPSVDALMATVRDQLMPALQQLWTQIAPILIPALQILGAIIGGLIIASLWLMINVIRIVIGVISGWISTIAAVISWLRSVWDTVSSVFGRIVGTISGALSGVWGAITDPFRRAFDWVKNAVNETVQKLKDLNPFQRHSPSLVDLITKGTDEIVRQYNKVPNQLENMQLTPGFGSANLAGVGINGGGSGNSLSTNFYGPINIASDADADSAISILARNQELARQGLTTKRPANA